MTSTLQPPHTQTNLQPKDTIADNLVTAHMTFLWILQNFPNVRAQIVDSGISKGTPQERLPPIRHPDRRRDAARGGQRAPHSCHDARHNPKVATKRFPNLQLTWLTPRGCNIPLFWGSLSEPYV